jgi:uncharacterized membrane protein
VLLATVRDIPTLMLAVADVYWKDFLASVAWAALVFYHDCCYMGAHCAYLHAHLNLELSGNTS